jgi:RNA polymerase sigma factor (sigma-70 family)
VHSPRIAGFHRVVVQVMEGGHDDAMKAAQARTDHGSGEIALLAARYRQPLISWFARRGVPADSLEDMAHEVFARLAHNRLQSVETPEAYLFTTASSVMIDRSRRDRARCRDQHVSIDGIDISSDAPSPARIFEGKEALMRLSTILDELPERTREIFLLSRLDRLSNTQLAARHGISVSAIEKHMTKALAHLRNRFGR